MIVLKALVAPEVETYIIKQDKNCSLCPIYEVNLSMKSITRDLHNCIYAVMFLSKTNRTVNDMVDQLNYVLQKSEEESTSSLDENRHNLLEVPGLLRVEFRMVFVDSNVPGQGLKGRVLDEMINGLWWVRAHHPHHE